MQRGSFGACLMAEPLLVADCIKAMRDVVSVPVTVKHRIGIDRLESYDFVRDFVGTVAASGGCEVFIVHARNAWLQGISPKENRELPPLRYETVAQLKREFPALAFVVNGGIKSEGQIAAQLEAVDGAMNGREAYHHPWTMASWDERFFGDRPSALERDAVEAAMVEYMERQMRERDEPWSRIARHMIGLRNGEPGARRWRQVWSDHGLKGESPRAVSRLARAALALPDDGRVLACDVSDEYTRVGRPYWKRAGVEHKIELVLEPAVNTLDARLAAGHAGRYDFAFIDADKPNYWKYYERCLALLRKGGVVAIDNTLWGGSVIDPADRSESTVALREFNQRVAKDRRVDIALVPVGDGLTLAVKR